MIRVGRFPSLDVRSVAELFVYARNKTVYPDIRIMPLVCPACRRPLEGLYLHGGSRYGFVGNHTCDYCDAKFSITDSDNIVEELRLYHLHPETKLESNLTLNYTKLYRLEPKVWDEVQVLTGYDIYAGPERIQLEQVMDDIETIKLVDLTFYRQQAEEEISKMPIPELPDSIVRWFALRRSMGLDQ